MAQLDYPYYPTARELCADTFALILEEGMFGGQAYWWMQYATDFCEKERTARRAVHCG